MCPYFPSGLNVGGDFSRVTSKSFASGFKLAFSFLSASNFIILLFNKEDPPTENSKVVASDPESN